MKVVGVVILLTLYWACTVHWGLVLGSKQAKKKSGQRWTAIFQVIPSQTDSCWQHLEKKITQMKTAANGINSWLRLHGMPVSCGKRGWQALMVFSIGVLWLELLETGRFCTKAVCSHAHSTAFKKDWIWKNLQVGYVTCAGQLNQGLSLSSWQPAGQIGLLLNSRNPHLQHRTRLHIICYKSLGRLRPSGALTGFTRCILVYPNNTLEAYLHFLVNKNLKEQ